MKLNFGFGLIIVNILLLTKIDFFFFALLNRQWKYWLKNLYVNYSWSNTDQILFAVAYRELLLFFLNFGDFWARLKISRAQTTLLKVLIFRGS